MTPSPAEPTREWEENWAKEMDELRLKYPSAYKGYTELGRQRTEFYKKLAQAQAREAKVRKLIEDTLGELELERFADAEDNLREYLDAPASPSEALREREAKAWDECIKACVNQTADLRRYYCERFFPPPKGIAKPNETAWAARMARDTCKNIVGRLMEVKAENPHKPQEES